MDYECIEIEKELIPYDFEVELEDQLFKLDIRYNETYDFFTVDLYKDDELIVAGEKLVYNVPLFESTYDPKTHPANTIIPLDPSGIESRVSWDNLNETVFLCIENGGDDDE